MDINQKPHSSFIDASGDEIEDLAEDDQLD